MWIEVFKTGKHTDANGNSVEYTADDISRIATKYNESVVTDNSNIAPIVKGHPKTDDPAYGWVERLKVNGEKLLAKVKDIVPEFAEEVKAGRFKKVSIALYPGNLLRHIGFLGAMAPAIKGLEPVAFADKGEYIEFANDSTPKLTELELAQQENRQLKEKLNSLENEKKDAEYNEFIDGLIDDSKISSHQAKTLKIILQKAAQSREYNEGESLTDLIKEFAGSIATTNHLLTEFAQNDIPEYDGQFEGKNTAPERLALHNKANSISRNNPNIPYEQALLLALDQ
ncbi:MAG: hypothetical protein CVV25_09145 [Ignavibacteriae bacterium HGW-Ignavibacteriae-4]|jgi:uncharacterized protein (UPF0335 family)|nr:MAG: hypothetical protein CVV25_09145 [Ignavibacteriae bacterium HGW-Ignavibacteriae-4]